MLRCHHQNDFCIKMGSDESHFNVSVGSDGQSHKTVSTNHNLFEEQGEPKQYRTEVLPLTSLAPYRQAKPAHIYKIHVCFHRPFSFPAPLAFEIIFFFFYCLRLIITSLVSDVEVLFGIMPTLGFFLPGKIWPHPSLF